MATSMPIVNNPSALINSTITNNGTLRVTSVDHAGRAGVNSIFGDTVVGLKKPSLSYQYNYGYRARDFNITESNGGAASTANSMIYLNTGTNAAGACVVESKGYLRYVPGHEAYSLFTVVFTPGKANSYQRAGIYDSSDGFFVGYEGTQFSITRRRAGVDETKVVNVAQVFPNGAFNPALGNVYKISFGYLGFAPIHFEVLRTDGLWVELGSFDYPNTSALPHITNTHLPIRGEVGNSGNTTDIQIASASVSAGIINGGSENIFTRAYTYNRGATATVAGSNMVVAFRNVTTYAGRTNRIKAVADLLSAATEGNKSVTWKILFNPTFTNTPTWNATDADSIIEYSTDATINFSTGVTGVVWSMAKSDSFFEDVSSLEGDINAGDYAVIVATSTSASEVEFSMRWRELF